jgi:hypothetical protein
MIKKNLFLKILIVSLASFCILVSLNLSNTHVFASDPTICNDQSTNTNGTNGYTAGTNVGSSAFCKDQSTKDPIFGTLNDAINIVTAIAGFVAVVLIVVSGFQMITSGGNPDKLATARNTIIYASIGLVIIALARIIIGFIINKIS